MDLFYRKVIALCNGYQRRARNDSPTRYSRDRSKFFRISINGKAKAFLKYGVGKRPKTRKKKLLKGRHITQKHRSTPNLEQRINRLSLVFPNNTGKKSSPKKIYQFKDYLGKKPSGDYRGSDSTTKVAKPNQDYKKPTSSYKKTG